MTTTRTVRQTVNALVKSYREEIQEAAGNNVLSAREEKKLSPWARKHISELRSEGDTVTVGKAVGHLKPIIERAAEAIAGRDGKIDSDDVRKLRVTELRTRAAALFDEEGGSTRAPDLRSALTAFEKTDLVSDYGKSLSLKSYGADATVKSILADISGVSEEDLGDDWFDTSRGASSVKGFADGLREAGKQHAEGMETDAESRKVLKVYSDAASAAQGAFKGDDYSRFVHASHSIAEDGDTEYSVLLAQKRDGSWNVLTYSDWPF